MLTKVLSGPQTGAGQSSDPPPPLPPGFRTGEGRRRDWLVGVGLNTAALPFRDWQIAG
jgi:hypothetical protein